MKSIFNHLNFEYMFERRRYGTGASVKFFTWVLYRKVGSLEWQSYGDPWPKPRLNKKEMAEVLSNITQRILPVGQRVNSHHGLGTIEGMNGEFFLVRLDNFSTQALNMHPGHITEVIS